MQSVGNCSTAGIKEKKLHFCKIDACGASFSRPYKLELHIKKHNGEVKYQNYPDSGLHYDFYKINLRRLKLNL